MAESVDRGRQLLDVLPTVSTTDEIRLERMRWGGFDAWRAELRLDPVVHPGETETRQVWMLVPYRDGLLGWVFKGRQLSRERIDRVRDAVRLQ